MKRFLVLLLLSIICLTKAISTPNYFNAGVQYGIGLSTIYKFTDTYGYFESLYYGKKPFVDIRVFVNRDITRNLSLESGIFYNAKGTLYRFFYSSKGIHFSFIDNPGGIDNEGLYLRYIEIPFVINSLTKTNNKVFWRYGLNVGYLFGSNMSYYIKSSDKVFNDFDIQGILGLKFCPENKHFFRNKSIIINLKCSIMPIVKTGEEYHYDPEKKSIMLPTK